MKQKNNPVKKAKNHNPFGLRKAILFAGIVSGLVSGYFLKNYYIGLCIHLAVVTLADQLFHYGFHLKASSFVDPKQLLEHEEISPAALDRHYDAKRNIRLLSLALAGISQAILLSPELFLGVFATSTLFARFYAWYYLDTVGPRILHELTKENESSLSETTDWNKEMDIGTATGVGPYGILKSDW